VETFRVCAHLCPMHQVRPNDHAGHLYSVTRRPQGDLPRPTSHIQQLTSSGNVEPFVESSRILLHVAREEVIVSGHPGLFQSCLQTADFRYGCDDAHVSSSVFITVRTHKGDDRVGSHWLTVYAPFTLRPSSMTTQVTGRSHCRARP